MIVLGLTGSVGMGKSTAAGMFRRLGVPVHDSDRAVHRLLGPGGAAVAAIDRAFPGVTAAGAVDRGALGERVFGDAAALAVLEGILHPLVRAAELRFLRLAAARRARLVVLDVPLLFETGGAARCDATLVVSAPRFLQEARVLSRPGMTRVRFDGILDRQMPDREKRRRADLVVPSGAGRRFSLRRIEEIVRLLRQPGDMPAPVDGRMQGGHARDRSRHRDHRARSRRGAPHRRDRLHRADQSRADRPQLPGLSQPRPRDAVGRLRGARVVRRIPRRAAALRRRRREVPRLPR